METFPIVKRKDVAAHGEYRTKRVILEMVDAMQAAMDNGESEAGVDGTTRLIPGSETHPMRFAPSPPAVYYSFRDFPLAIGFIL